MILFKCLFPTPPILPSIKCATATKNEQPKHNLHSSFHRALYNQSINTHSFITNAASYLNTWFVYTKATTYSSSSASQSFMRYVHRHAVSVVTQSMTWMTTNLDFATHHSSHLSLEQMHPGKCGAFYCQVIEKRNRHSRTRAAKASKQERHKS